MIIDRMRGFFKEWSTEKDVKDWTAVTRFQDMVKQRRLDEKHAKETNPIDTVMGTVKEIPEDFKKWVSEKAMSFSRYLVYSTRSKNEALVHCTHCNGETLVDRTKIRLRNNEKGICPLCGSQVTIKARGRMPAHIWDKRIVSFIEPREEGFLWRYFSVHREVKQDGKTNDSLLEIVRTFYKFAPNGTPCTSSYEYREYKQTGIVRWCTDEGYRERSYCALYPGNLPEAWKDTPMKYSALEILSENRPSEQIHYANAIYRYQEFPQLEWFIKMGLYKLAAHLINKIHDGAFEYNSRNGIRGLRKNGKTIFEILGLTKENTRILQSIDGNIDELRLLQEAQSSGYNLKAEELERFYKLFGCNTTLIRKENRHSTIHKICRYIEREGSDYRVGERGGCWRYSYMQYKERPDIREERLQNCAKDWLDYLAWCKELKYDLTNMFFYFPKNFKKVHDRTAAEYQAVQDKKAAEKKRREEERIKREAEVMKKLLEEMLKENAGIDNAFLIKGKGLIIEGKYFDYNRFFMAGKMKTYVSRPELVAAMTRAKMCTEEKKPAVFEMNEDQLNIRIADRLTDYQEEVKLQDPLPEPLKIGFDSKLVLETLKAFTCENIAMNFSGPKMPAVVEAEDSDMKAIVLPVMIREE